MTKLPPYMSAAKRANGTARHYFHMTPSRKPPGWPERAEPWPEGVNRSNTPRLADDLRTAIRQATQLNKALATLRAQAAPVIKNTPRKGSIPWLIDETLHSSIHAERVGAWSENHRRNTERAWAWWMQQSAKLASAHRKMPLADVGPVDHVPVSETSVWSGRNIIKALQQPDVRHKLHTRRAYRAALAALYKTALIEGIVTRSPVQDVPLPTPKSTFHAFSEEEIETLVTMAPDVLGENGPRMQRLIVLMSEIGQREGDALRLCYGRDYRAGEFRFRQSKTGTPLVIPATEYLKQHIGDGFDAIGPIVEWPHSVDHLRHEFRRLCRAADLPDEAKLMHLRHFAIGMLAELGFDAVQIRSISGHSLATINQMLEGHYLARSSRTARMIVSKMDEYRRSKGA